MRKRWKLTEETKQKIRLSKLGKSRPDMKGDKNKSWVGGKDGYCKRQTLIRDNFICQECGYSNKDIMIVDHIKPKSLYPELKYVIDNLRTLCPNCNAIKTLQDIKKYQVNRRRSDKWNIVA